MEKRKELEIYIHIPFCIKKCRYCDFLSSSATQEVQDAYMEALCNEAAGRSTKYRDYHVVSVFIGGGTPSIVNPMWINKLLKLLKEKYYVDKDAEITIEMNPGTVNEQALEIYKMSGINRLSIGLQSTNNKELEILGRIHTFEDFLNSYFLARKLGFENINVDIMSALPGQTFTSYSETLNNILNLEIPPEHISAYSLIVEEGTAFRDMYDAGTLELPQEETERQMYVYTEEFLAKKGYLRYEISNYAKAGRECRHNIGYWERREYLGLGIGAASLIDNRRFSNTSDRTVYIINPMKEYEDVQQLSISEQMEETMFLGLRMTKGIKEKDFEKKFGKSLVQVYGDVIRKHLENGLLQRYTLEGESWISLTKKGLDVSNYVMADFLGPVLF